MRNKKPPHVRWLVRRDLPAVLAIEAANPDGWTEAEYLAALRQRDVISMGAEDRYGTPVGYFIYRLHRTHLELLRLAVHPDHRRTGIGTALLAKFAFKVVSHVREFGSARVPDNATGAHLFFRSCGWTAVGVTGDAYWFEYRPPAPAGSTTGRVSAYQEGDLE